MPNNQDKCIFCKYNTNSPICHPNCGGCDGASRYEPHKMKIYKTIAVDFDGTLCESRFPDIGEPKPLVIDFIKRQQAAGAHIILHTCRENGANRALLDEAVQFCKEQGIELYAINENPDNTYGKEFGVEGAGRKVFADLYIDDKSVNTAQVEIAMQTYLKAGEIVEKDT